MHFQIFTKTVSNSLNNENQDFVIYSKNNYNQSLFAIADGVGSYKKSQTAAKISCLFLEKVFLQTDFSNFNNEQMTNWAKKIIQKDLQMELKKNSEKMATTLSFIIVKDKNAYLFHVGDTRIYQKKINSLKCLQLTRDHTVQTSANNSFFWQNSKKFLQNSVSNFRNCDLDITHFLIENGYLLFSTDGFHDFVSFDEISQILNREKLTEHEKIKILFDKVIYSGSTDDITLLLVKINGVQKF